MELRKKIVLFLQKDGNTIDCQCQHAFVVAVISFFLLGICFETSLILNNNTLGEELYSIIYRMCETANSSRKFSRYFTMHLANCNDI